MSVQEQESSTVSGSDIDAGSTGSGLDDIASFGGAGFDDVGAHGSERLGDGELDDDPAAFGTFFVGDAEFAIDTRWLREVVPFPEGISPVPLAAPSVLGIFSLRGQTVPIVDLGIVLGEEGREPDTSRRVAIIDDGSSSIGIVVDRTGEVVRPSPEEVHSVEHENCHKGHVVVGVLSLEDGERFVQLLSVELLGDLDDVPRSGSTGQSLQAAERTSYENAVVARVGDYDFAFPMSSIFEIQDDLPVQTSPRYFDHCEGVVQVRGELRPVMSLREALGLSREHESRRILFLQHEASCVGLVVDRLVESLEYPTSCRLPVPRLLDADVTRLSREVLSMDDGRRHIFLISGEDLFDTFNLSNAERALGKSSAREEAKIGRRNEHEGSFLTFRVADQTISVALEEVREVHEQNEGVFMTCDPNGGNVSGLMNIRGEVVPLVDVARRFGVQREDSIEDRVVVVVEHDNRSFGLLVDEVTDIARVTSASAWNQNKMPSVFGGSDGVMQCLKTALLVEKVSGEGSTMLAVVDVGKVVGDMPAVEELSPR